MQNSTEAELTERVSQMLLLCKMARRVTRLFSREFSPSISLCPWWKSLASSLSPPSLDSLKTAATRFSQLLSSFSLNELLPRSSTSNHFVLVLVSNVSAVCPSLRISCYADTSLNASRYLIRSLWRKFAETTVYMVLYRILMRLMHKKRECSRYRGGRRGFKWVNSVMLRLYRKKEFGPSRV